MENKQDIKENNITFDSFGLGSDLLKALKKKGFEKATEIQAKVIPLLLEQKHDVIGIAQTGTGKTAAFGLPIIENIEEKNKNPQAIILAPTRELAIQVCDELKTYKGHKKLNIITVYGGASINTQISALKRGVDIVVGTPGRVLDLIKRKQLNLEEIEYFILDEADEMLNMGFIDDIEMILGSASKKKRVLLFSATMPAKIKQLSKKYMKKQIIVEAKKKKQNMDLIEQIHYKVKASEKFDALSKLIDMETFFYGIVFCKTKRDVEEVTSNLKRSGHSAGCIHGDITQSKRERILNQFKDQKLSILVATDVAARGIDVENLTHVINHSLPQEIETYVHRIGRTGRAGNKGTAVSLVTPREMSKLSAIERVVKATIKKDKLPNNKEVQLKKNNKIQDEINVIVEKKDTSKFLEVADSLIEKHGSTKAVLALLYKINSSAPSQKNDRHSRGDRFSRDRPSKGGDRFSRDRPSKGGNMGSRQRLFVAKGKKDGFNNRTLMKFIEKESNLKQPVKANDIKVCDNFSFLTVSSRDSEPILKHFKNENPRRPLVEIASR